MIGGPAGRLVSWIGPVIVAAGLIGCAPMQVNPSFNLSIEDARQAMREMAERPRKLERPVLVLAGFADPGIASSSMARRLRKSTGDDRVVAMAFPLNFTFDACRKRAIRAVDDAYPCDDPVWTTEVDVVAFSMGGLVATAAAAEPANPGERRLKIARLFTISTPHRGAALAGLPTFDPRQIDMRPGSAFLQRMAEARAAADYRLYTYTRLDDLVVGETNTAPDATQPWWVATPALEGAHLTAFRDPRIMADIARRLRGEPPYATDPPSPLPEEKGESDQDA